MFKNENPRLRFGILSKFTRNPAFATIEVLARSYENSEIVLAEAPKYIPERTFLEYPRAKESDENLYVPKGSSVGSNPRSSIVSDTRNENPPDNTPNEVGNTADKKELFKNPHVFLYEKAADKMGLSEGSAGFIIKEDDEKLIAVPEPPIPCEKASGLVFKKANPTFCDLERKNSDSSIAPMDIENIINKRKIIVLLFITFYFILNMKFVNNKTYFIKH